MNNTASLAEIKDAEKAANQPPPAAPETTPIRGLQNVKKPARSKYTFFAYKKVQATYEFRLNKQAWESCSSPFVLRTKKIRTGKHIFAGASHLPGRTARQVAREEVHHRPLKPPAPFPQQASRSIR